MLLRTIIGSDMRDGMRRVREQLGDDAIIVQVEEMQGGGVLLLAAADADAPAPKAAEPVSAPKVAETGQPPIETAPTNVSQPPPERLFEQVAEALSFHRCPPAISERLIEAMEGADLRSPESALSAALGAALGFGDSVPERAAPTVLVGAPGSGKTVTLAKLAAEAALAGRRVGIVTADVARAGGVAQIDTFAGALGIDVLQATTPREVQDALLALGQSEAVFIDTPAATPFVPAEAAEAIGLARAAKGEILPVLAAGLDPVESAETAAAWREAGARRCIVTRTDAVRRLGGLLAAAGAGLRVGQIGVSRAIARGLAPATPDRVAALLLAAPVGGKAPTMTKQ